MHEAERNCVTCQIFSPENRTLFLIQIYGLVQSSFYYATFFTTRADFKISLIMVRIISFNWQSSFTGTFTLWLRGRKK